MDEPARLLLERVDQNVINLIKVFDKHLTEDKEFQDEFRKEINGLKEERAERQGMVKFASMAYSIVAGCIGTVIGIKYGSK